MRLVATLPAPRLPLWEASLPFNADFLLETADSLVTPVVEFFFFLRVQTDLESPPSPWRCLVPRNFFLSSWISFFGWFRLRACRVVRIQFGSFILRHPPKPKTLFWPRLTFSFFSPIVCCSPSHSFPFAVPRSSFAAVFFLPG